MNCTYYITYTYPHILIDQNFLTIRVITPSLSFFTCLNFLLRTHYQHISIYTKCTISYFHRILEPFSLYLPIIIILPSLLLFSSSLSISYILSPLFSHFLILCAYLLFYPFYSTWSFLSTSIFTSLSLSL